MFTRLTIAAAVIGFLAGYAANASPTAAQTNGLPFPINGGEKISLVYEHGIYQSFDNVNCVVAEVQVGWIRCAPADPIGLQRDQEWHSLKQVVRVIKRAN